MPSRFTQFFKSWNQIAIPVLIAIYIAINLFRVGGDAFIIKFNGFLVIPFALGTTFFAWVVLRQIQSGGQNQLLWFGLTCGWVLWTIAELWWFLFSLIGQEVPYPSLADFLWLTGYIPFYYAFRGRLRSLPRHSSSGQRVGMLVISLFLVGFTALLVILPIIRASDPTALVPNLISVSYPLADTIILIVVLQVLFSYQGGMYGRAWRWIASGFVLSSVSDLLFAFAITNNLYYPEQRVNLVSTLGIDIPYNFSYLVWMIGLYQLQNLVKKHQPVIRDVKKLSLVPNTHLLVFTKGDDAVIYVSHNYSRVYSDDAVQEKTIAEVLGLPPEVESALLNELKARSVLEEKTYRSHTRLGQKDIHISGIVVLNPQKGYFGAMLLVRLMVEEDNSLDDLLTEYENGMVRSLLGKTGTDKKEQAEKEQLLTEYHGAHLAALYNRAFSEGGSIFADALITDLQSVAEKLGLQVQIQPDSLDVGNIPISEARKVLPLLLESASKFVTNLTNEGEVKAIVQEISSQFGDVAVRNVSYVVAGDGEQI